jgi:DNA gyrase subunit A
MMISSGGKMVRTAIAPIRPIGRSTQGVCLIRLNESDKLVAVARVASEGSDDRPDTDDKDQPPAADTDK